MILADGPLSKGGSGLIVFDGEAMNLLLAAANFAATKHSRQRRKDSEGSPYINHPIEVAEHLARVGGIEDEEVLIAALLHDTIEDTATTADEIRELFGDRVTKIVLECTDDKSLDKPVRKRLQIENAPHKSVEAKCVKIADKTCNLKSILIDPPVNWSVQRQIDYFAWAESVVAGLVGVNAGLDNAVLRVLQEGKALLDNRRENL